MVLSVLFFRLLGGGSECEHRPLLDAAVLSPVHTERELLLSDPGLSRVGTAWGGERERDLCTINISVWYFCAAMVMQYLYALHGVLMFAFVMIPIVYEWNEGR